MILALLCGCGNTAVTDTSKSNEEISTTDNNVDNKEDEDLQAKYDQLLADYEELEDYTTFLEQEILRLEAESQMIREDTESIVLESSQKDKGLVPPIEIDEEN